ncbi:hypothetical protein EK904_002222, partial [Melospiza melodia maxima]
ASAMTDELNIKPLTEGKRDSDKESMLNVIKNSDGQFNLEAAIKNVDTMSNELKKINGNSDFTIQLNTKLCKTLLEESAVGMAWFSVSHNWVLM